MINIVASMIIVFVHRRPSAIQPQPKTQLWRGTGTTHTDANNNYAGFPTNYTDIMLHTEYNETDTTTQIGYKIDVPITQKSGIYSGDITYQVTTAP